LLLQRISGVSAPARTVPLEATIEFRASVAAPNTARDVVTRLRDDGRRA
jgi:hypothetical protein